MHSHPPALLERQFAPARQQYNARDTMLYALGLGLGTQPDELRYVYEAGLHALATQAVTLCWAPTSSLGLGLDLSRAVHADQSLVIHRPLAPEGDLIAELRVAAVVDLGAEKGALVHIERALRDAVTDEPVATATMGLLCRSDGGFGGQAQPRVPLHEIPARPCDHEIARTTLPQASLIYRLNGDINPLHADPAFAQRVGFPRPILHGLLTYGIAGYAIVHAVCGGDPSRLKELHGRFTSPVFPGETLKTQIWDERGGQLAFRVIVAERDKVAFDNGRAVIGN